MTRTGTWPTLSYADADAAIVVLTDTVGFTTTAVYRDENGLVAHAELRWPGGGGIMLGTDRGTDSWNGSSRIGAGAVYLSTDDVQVVADRVSAAGLRILRPVAETDYGSTEFAFLDAEGNAFSVGTYDGHQDEESR